MLRMSVERDNGYLSWLGVQLEDIEYGAAELSIPFDERFADKDADPPAVHEGITATLAAQTGELAIRTTMPDPVNDRVAVLNLDVNYHAAAVDDLTAVGEVVDAGDGSAVAAVTVESRDANGDLCPVASGQSVYRIGD